MGISAQSIDENSLKRMLIEQWTGDDGLVSNNLTFVAQSSDGFIWLTSFNGAHRFDGKQFTLFDKSNVPVLTSNAFYGVVEMDGKLWFGSQSSGLISYDGKHFSKRLDFPSISVRTMFVARSGSLWIGTNNSGVYVLENDTIKAIGNRLLDHEIINDIDEDADGNIMFATGSNGLLKYSKGEVHKYQLDKLNNDVRTLSFNSDTLSIGASNGLYFLVADQLFEASGLSKFQINDILYEKPGSYLLATEQGLVRYFVKSGKVDVWDESSGLPANQLSKITYDHEGSLWVSTKKAGLLRLYNGTIKTLSDIDGLPYPKINIVKEYKGSFYIGADDGAISILTNDKITDLKLSPHKNKVGIRDMVFDKDGSIWVASYEGLLRYKNGKESIFNTANGLTSNNVRRILPDDDGNLWIGTRTGGLMKWSGDSVREVFNTTNKLKSDYILSIEMDRNKNIVVGTHSGGINLIKNDSVYNYSLDSMPGILYFNNYIDKENNYWFATNVGILCFHDGKFKKIKLHSDFKAETYFDIVADDYDNLWMTTNIGIVRVGYTDMRDFVEGKSKFVEASIFDESDGMLQRECTGATKSLKTSNGSVWVPTLNGVAMINPSSIIKNEHIPNVVISKFKVDGTSFIDDNVIIEPGAHRFSFNYSVLSFIAPEKIQYKYKLEGIDKEWITTFGNELEYTNLGPGQYVFNVTGTNNDGIWSDHVATVKFTVEPYFYETIFFYILLLICLVVFTWYFIKIRTSRIQKSNAELIKVNKELDRFVYSASHDLRAPLASVLGLVAIGKIENSLDSKNKCFDMIDESINKLDVFITEIIDFSKNQRLEISNSTFDIKEFIDEILTELKYLDRSGKINIQVNCDIEKVHTDKHRLSVILHNLIANAINYNDNKNGYLKINVQEEKSKIRISVEDNGRGIAPEHLGRIFEMFYRAEHDKSGSGLGLYIVKETIEKLKGYINVESKLDVGTTFTVYLPIIRTGDS
ncbi:MAG TPA: two-component regulator propeller domain-containing protein [Fulvivirga sp.]|nr:two-component regulator propeller domain-containing protein [Fulvivirga sp.]